MSPVTGLVSATNIYIIIFCVWYCCFLLVNSYHVITRVRQLYLSQMCRFLFYCRTLDVIKPKVVFFSLLLVM